MLTDTQRVGEGGRPRREAGTENRDFLTFTRKAILTKPDGVTYDSFQRAFEWMNTFNCLSYI